MLNSPNKDELKKEIKYLASKNKNYEKKLERSKAMEENCKLTHNNSIKRLIRLQEN